MNKKIIISFVLSSALCAPFAQAMNSLLPKVRPVAQMLMNPRVRSALITQGQTIAHAAAPQTQRGLMMLAQSTVRPANQWLLNGPNLTRQLSTTTRQQAATSMKSLALKAGVVGLAYAASPATVACSDGSSLIANGVAILVGVLGFGGILLGYPDATPGVLLSKHPMNIRRVTEGMRGNPDYARKFAELVTAENFMNIDASLLMCIVAHYPESAEQFTPYAAPHIELLAKDLNGLWLLEQIMKHNPKSAEQFALYAVAHIESLMKDKNGMRFLSDVMKHNPEEAAKQFASHAAPHIKSLVSSEAGMEFLHDIMHNNPHASEQFAPYAIQNFRSLVNDATGRTIFVSIANSNATAKTALLAEFKKHIGDTSDVSSALTWEGMFYRLLNSESLTPTEFGLLYAAKEIAEHRKQVLKDPNIKKVVDTVIDLEKKYEPTHYTFTHGRNRAYECVSTVYGALWKYAYNTEIPEGFIFTHTKDVHDPLMHTVKLHEEKKLHEANIKERDNISGEIRNRRLFLNTQLFGNMQVRGSSSFSYFLHSSNASGVVKVKAKDVFGQFGQQALYEKYKDEFEALEKEHTALSEQGELLVVAVPKDRVNQDVTCMHVNGRAAPQYMINGKMTNNVQEILEARKKDPSVGDNVLNFTLAMTDTAALDPKSGIKIHSVQKIDEEKYAAWQAKLDALMAKVEAEFKASWQQSLKAKERGHRDLLDAVRATQKYMSDKK